MDFELSDILKYCALGIAAIVVVMLFIRAFITVPQGSVTVIEHFGKFQRIALPGLSMRNPLFDRVHSEISVQNRAEELKFQAITMDQANVYFQAMLLFSVKDSASGTIHKVAYKFVDDEDLGKALTRTIEGTIRTFVGGKKQSEILILRREIVDYVKEHLDSVLEEWGYHLIDVQINDITFDAVIMESMARVVSSSNLRAAAENEGAALLIQKTKAAEAEGKYIVIQAESEKTAAKLRGEGVAEFRKAVAEGLAESAAELKDSGMGSDVIMFTMWTEAIKNFAEVGKGNTILLDGSTDSMQRIFASMQGAGRKAFQPLS